jgi:hypothetical protein
MTWDQCSFGVVVEHYGYGLGMIEALIPKNQTVNVAFASECVNMSPVSLEPVGHIEQLRRPRGSANSSKPDALNEDRRRARTQRLH